MIVVSGVMINFVVNNGLGGNVCVDLCGFGV